MNFKTDEKGNLICPNGKNLFINMINMFTKTSMDEQKKYTNAKIAQDVLTKISAAKEYLEIGQ